MMEPAFTSPSNKAHGENGCECPSLKVLVDFRLDYQCMTDPKYLDGFVILERILRCIACRNIIIEQWFNDISEETTNLKSKTRIFGSPKGEEFCECNEKNRVTYTGFFMEDSKTVSRLMICKNCERLYKRTFSYDIAVEHKFSGASHEHPIQL